MNYQSFSIKLSKLFHARSLVGLDRKPPQKGTRKWKEASDRRFEHRIQAFITSQDYVKGYSLADESARILLLPCIKTIVIHQGFWSICMRTFEAFPEVQKELIISFNGTRTKFFKL